MGNRILIFTAERGRRGAEAARGKNRKKGKGRPDVSDPVYSADQIEFMFAVQARKNVTGRAIPTAADVLFVARSLGYRKTT